MSQWTHVLGIVRFENLEQSAYPVPLKFDPERKKALVRDIFSEKDYLPMGSEGPLEINTILTLRGPAVMIVGDLRDFGLKDLGIIKIWLNKCIKEASDKTLCLMAHGGFPLYMRDGFVYCDVEGEDASYTMLPIEVGEGKDFHQEFALFKDCIEQS